MSARIVTAQRWIDRFAFTPARAEPLAVLRIGLAFVLLVQAALVAPAYRELFARSGFVSGALHDLLARGDFPHVGGLIRRLAPLGIGEAAVLSGVGGLYVISLAALLLGLWTRVAAALSWFLHMVFLTTGDGTNYGADQLAHVFLFYLVLAPAGAALSVDRLRGNVAVGPSSSARFALRVIQLHLCVIYLTGGVSKALSRTWWNGDTLWRVVMTPEYCRFDLSWLASHPWVTVVSGWGVLVVEIGYAVLIWPRATRRAWVLATAVLHVGIAVFMGLAIFGAVMLVFTVAAFGVRAEPRGA